MKDLDNIVPIINEGRKQFKTLRQRLLDVKFWSIFSFCFNTVTIVVFLFGFFTSQPVAKEAWKSIEAKDKAQDEREKLLDLEAKRLEKERRDLLRFKDTLYYELEILNSLKR